MSVSPLFHAIFNIHYDLEYMSFDECCDRASDIFDFPKGERPTGSFILELLNNPKKYGIIYQEPCASSGLVYTYARDGETPYYHIQTIKNFVELCSSDKTYCSEDSLLAFLKVTGAPLPYHAIAFGDYRTIKFDDFKSERITPTDKCDNIKDKIDTLIQANEDTYHKLYSYFCYNVFEVCIASLHILFINNFIIKKCSNCGLYFIPTNRADTLYCNNAAPQKKAAGRTCKEYGAYASREKLLKEDESAGLYRKIYMSKQMLAKRNPDLPEYQQSFDKFRSGSKQWKTDIKAGTKTEDEYVAWLKSVKEKKVL